MNLRSQDDAQSQRGQQGVPVEASHGAGAANAEAEAPRAGQSTPRSTVHPYFRWLGPTSIAPPASGVLRLLSVNMKTDDSLHEKTSVFLKRKHSDASEDDFSSLGDDYPMPDFTTDMPLPKLSLLKAFSRHLSNWLPYMPFAEFEKRLQDRVVGSSLQYAMGALGLRAIMAQKQTSGDDHAALSRRCALYSDLAKKLLLPHLSSPSVDVVYASLLIAVNEFAEDRDAGLWVWIGIALRIAVDLGLHKAAPSPDDDPELTYGQNVFWSIVFLDRIVSCGTGRTTSIPDSMIDYIPAHRSVGERPDPFPYVCRLMLLLGRVSDCLNNYSATHDDTVGSISNMSPSTSSLIDKIQEFQGEASDFYASLPPELLFDVTNFQEYVKLGCSQVFLLLHIWNQALILAIYHPSLVYPKIKINISGLSNPHEITGTGAISIADMIAFVDLVDSTAFLANPFINQPIYMAACASLSGWQSLGPRATSYPMFTLQRTYTTCRDTLARMQNVWNGISWLQRTLESLAAHEPDVDLSVPMGSVITRDVGIVRKALAEDSTKRWLKEISKAGSDDAFGLFIAGLDQPTNQPTFPAQASSVFDDATTISGSPLPAATEGDPSVLTAADILKLGSIDNYLV